MSILQPEIIIAFLSLAAMEIVLGIDNLVFIAILVARVQEDRRELVRKIGVALALVLRIGLLLTLSWIMSLTQPLFSVAGFDVSGRTIILMAGGLFLIAKSTREIADRVELSTSGESETKTPLKGGVASAIVQIIIIDLVFSLDSVITAVGMAQQLWVMIAAMVVAVVVMFAFSRSVGNFVERHPSIKVLALSFLILIGVMLVADALGRHIPKGYIYFAMAFSLSVEMINLRMRSGAAKAGGGPVEQS